jgi:hypothetical protein
MAPYYFTPTDRVASNLEEFLVICQQEPGVAEHHLREGWFSPWLSDAGYGQLAKQVGRKRRPSLARFLAVAEGRPPATRRRVRAVAA